VAARRSLLADRPVAVSALTKIFIAEIERLLLRASVFNHAATTPAAARPRLGGISFLHRFGSALNHHVHLHACVTDGVFGPAAEQAATEAPPVFIPSRPITAADLAAVTERVRRRVIRWFRHAGLLDAHAAADMLAWVNSGFSVDASVGITLLDRDADGRITRIRYVLPRHKAATMISPGATSTWRSPRRISLPRSPAPRRWASRASTSRCPTR